MAKHKWIMTKFELIINTSITTMMNNKPKIAAIIIVRHFYIVATIITK